MKYVVAIKEQDHEERIYKAPIKGQIYVVKDVGDPDGKWIVDKNGEKVCGELSFKGREFFEEIDPIDIFEKEEVVEYKGEDYNIEEVGFDNERSYFEFKIISQKPVGNAMRGGNGDILSVSKPYMPWDGEPYYDERTVSPEDVRLKRYGTDYSFHSMKPIDFVRDYLGYFEPEPFKTECQGTFEEKSGGTMKKVNLNGSKIWVGDSEFLSSAVQQKLFTLGIRWADGKTNIIKGLDSFYIHEWYFCQSSGGRGYYNEHEHEELSLDKLFSLTPEDVQIEKDLYLGEHRVEFPKGGFIKVGCSTMDKQDFIRLAKTLKGTRDKNNLDNKDLNSIQISDIIDFYETNRDKFQ